MTNDEIIEMAKQATIGGDRIAVFTLPELMKFSELVAQYAKAEEREACANLRKEVGLLGKQSTEYEEGFWDGLHKYEDLIRARGQT